MTLKPMRIVDMPIGAEYLDATGARARVTTMLLATPGTDLLRVVPAIVPDDNGSTDGTPAAILLLLQAFPESEILEVTES